ncbi:MAG: hypothetical protein C0609_00390 [Deltaproteobacteria bacterium]|nr:MAG: hypothetical protein C0609_00390 [Deltaproteobacteria bacterium]
MRFDLNLKQLKIFYYAARHLNFRRAAEELFVSQPAVSMQIQSLEEAFGTPLFSRAKKKLALTEAGRLLFTYAERIMHLAVEAEQAIEGVKAAPKGVLKIGTTPIFAKSLLTLGLMKFHERFPEIRIEVNQGSSERMSSSILYGENDLAVVGRVPYDERILARPFPELPEDELLLIVPEKHHLAESFGVTVHDLEGLPLIMRERGSATRHALTKRFDAEGVKPTVAIEASDLTFIGDLVERGYGAAVLGRVAFENELARAPLTGVPFAGGPLRMGIDVVLPREERLNDAANKFLSLLFEG